MVIVDLKQSFRVQFLATVIYGGLPQTGTLQMSWTPTPIIPNQHGHHPFGLLARQGRASQEAE